MNTVAVVAISSASGGLITSLIEYLKSYNLVDLIVDFFKKAESKVTSEVKKGVTFVDGKL